MLSEKVINIQDYVRRRHRPAEKPSIDAAIGRFLQLAGLEMENMPSQAFREVEKAFHLFRTHIDVHAESTLSLADGKALRTSKQTYCSHFEPERLVQHIDYFFRYCLLRELILDDIDRAFIESLISDFMEWMHDNGLISRLMHQNFIDLRLQQFKDDVSAVAASELLSERVRRVRKPRQIDAHIEFARHDIIDIEKNNVWLEIWSTPVLPDNTEVGPITLPEGVTDYLQIGWMIECEVVQWRGKWKLIDSGKIYPSLPFGVGGICVHDS